MGKQENDRIATVVETGMVELAGGRLQQAGRQFELARTMCSTAADARPIGVGELPSPADRGIERDPRYSSSLELGLRVLACFTADRPLWGIAELAQELGAARSTVHRYCLTLVKLGQLTQEGVAGRGYRRLVPAPEVKVLRRAAQRGIDTYARESGSATVSATLRRSAAKIVVEELTGEGVMA